MEEKEGKIWRREYLRIPRGLVGTKRKEEMMWSYYNLKNKKNNKNLETEKIVKLTFPQ